MAMTRTKRMLTLIRPAVLAVAVLACEPIVAVPNAHAQSSSGASSDVSVKSLEQPRFHSLKSDRVNVRRGPGLQYPIAWVFRRIGMPVEVIREFENWWQIRDSEGALGWVFKGLLARRRTALLVPWLGSDPDAKPVAIRASAGAESIVALAEPGTIANVRECDGRWCRVTIEPYEGWVDQALLWGVYPQEKIRR